MEQRLYVGFDLCDDYSQISCYNERTFEPESIYVNEKEDSYLIPTLLAVKHNTKEWLYGEDARICWENGEGMLIEHILETLIHNSTITVMEKEISGELVLERFFRKTLWLLKKSYPNDAIRKIVVTIEERWKSLTDLIYQALEKMGLNRDRTLVQCHEQSFIYYTLSQKKELWMNDVGLFDFNEKGLFFHQLSINRKVTPMVVGIVTKDFSNDLSQNILWEAEDKSTIAYLFETIAKSALFKQIISTIYLTGNGFEGDWANDIFKELAIGRRVFVGRNLYSRGACYCGKEIVSQGKLEEFIFLSDEIITSSVLMKVYVNAKMEEILLAKAGTPWNEVDQSIDVIPDYEDEVQIILKNIMKRESVAHLIHIDVLEGRPNRTTRLTVRIRFVNAKTCIITVKDRGFGDFYPTSNRIWEKEILL